MKRIPGFVLQVVEEDTFAVAVTPEATEKGSMIKLNSTAAFLFAFLEEEHSEDECIAALTAQFSVDADTAARDVRRFLEGLRAAGLLL